MELGRIKTHFPNLRSISIDQMEQRNEEISDFLASYGEKLEYCYVSNTNESELETIANACKNVRFCAQVRKNKFIIPNLKILGRQLENIKIWDGQGDDGVLDIDGFTGAWAGCVNIQDPDVHLCTIKMAKVVMATRKKHLRTIQVHTYESLENDIFSKGACSVQEITYNAQYILDMPSMKV